MGRFGTAMAAMATEHEDGQAFDGSGIGRGWPLLTGERGHYELCAGRDPLPFLQAIVAMASPGGMIPEQVWDAASIPGRRLFPGQPSGSAMPLAWAHAEFIKLVVSRHLGQPFDRPRAVWRRYQGQRRVSRYAFWWPQAPITARSGGTQLAVALPRPAVVHGSGDNWHSVFDKPTSDTGLGFHVAVLDAELETAAQRIDFTWRWHDTGEWVGRDHFVDLISASNG